MGDASNHPVWVRGLSAVALTLPCHVNHVHGPTAYRVIAPATLQTGGQTENADKQSVQLLNHSVTQSLILHKTTPSIAGSDSRSLESACWLIGGGGTRKGRLHLSHPAWVPQGLSVPDDPAKAHSAHEGLAWHLLVENQDEGELEDGRRKRRMM